MSTTAPNPAHAEAQGLPDPLGATHAAFSDAARAALRSAEWASRAYSAFHRDGVVDADLPDPPRPIRVETGSGPHGLVRKFLLPVPARRPGVGADEVETESVVIPMRHRGGRSETLCVSSQVGCAMGCTFCETAQMGLVRSLTPGEIVAQWWAARHAIGATPRAIVFMGMGEPLDNVEGVLGAIEVLTDQRGPAIAARRVTISTVGRLDGLGVLRERVTRPGWKQLNLAVSINAPNDEIRSSIMPLNRAMPLGELIGVLETWPLRHNRAICCEYVLIPGVNDADEHADELAERLKRVRCAVNVIPYNPRRGSPWDAPSDEAVTRFLDRLAARGQFCTRRRTKGRDAMAACGQLGNERIRGRRFVGVGVPPAAD